MGEDLTMWSSIKMLSDQKSLSPQAVGLEAKFKLSYHFELAMPGTYHEDPLTKVKAWSEPVLVVFVSVNHPDLPNSPHVLHYGLSRSFFSSPPDPSNDDQEKLLSAARQLLKADIERIGDSSVPNLLHKTKFI